MYATVFGLRDQIDKSVDRPHIENATCYSLMNSKNCNKNMNPIEIYSTIRELENSNPENLSVLHIRKKLGLIFENFSHTEIELSIEHGSIYRAIRHPKKPHTKSGLIYPRADMVDIPFGRANFPGSPVFYCAGDPRATLFELSLQQGDTIVLSEWKIKTPVLISLIGYTAETFKKLQSNRKCPIVIPPTKRHPNESKPSNAKISNFLNTCFTKKIPPADPSFYKLTASIAEKYLSLRPQCGIAYPAISMKANAENFVLTPALADNLTFKKVKWCRIDHVDGLDCTLTILEVADSFLDGQIAWRSPTAEERENLSS